MEENDSVSTSDFIHSDNFMKCIEKAASSRLEIMDNYSPEMKELKTEFFELMVNSKKKMDKEEEKELKKTFGKAFKQIVDYQHYQGGWPKPDSKAKLDILAEKVELAIKYFDFMKNPLFRDQLAKRGIYIDDSKTSKLIDDYPHLTPELGENMQSIINDGDTCQANICNTADNIKINIYDSDIPEEAKYSKDNKSGLKRCSFNKLVTVNAMKSKKNDEKMEKYINNLTENSILNVTREELMQQGFEEINK